MNMTKLILLLSEEMHMKSLKITQALWMITIKQYKLIQTAHTLIIVEEIFTSIYKIIRKHWMITPKQSSLTSTMKILIITEVGYT
jgi:hypothetical protein